MAVRSFPNTTEAVAAARRFTLENVTGITAELTDELLVMVSELTTNSVRHTATPFTVEIDQDPDEIYVAVTDRGPGDPAVRHPAATEESGRGLQIVGALSDAWGVRRHDHEPGKTVWFTVRY